MISLQTDRRQHDLQTGIGSLDLKADAFSSSKHFKCAESREGPHFLLSLIPFFASFFAGMSVVFGQLIEEKFSSD